jgi:hypothetical protein
VMVDRRTEERRHLKALAFMWQKEGKLQELMLDRLAP